MYAKLLLASTIGLVALTACAESPATTPQPAPTQSGLPAAQTLVHDQGVCRSTIYPSDTSVERSFLCHLYAVGNRMVLNTSETQLVMAGRWSCQQVHLNGLGAVPRLVAGTVSQRYTQAEAQDFVNASINHFCAKVAGDQN